MSALVLLALTTQLRVEAKQTARKVEFVPGDYSVVVEAIRNVAKRKVATGSLMLRPTHFDIGDGLSYPYSGWTDVDFRGLGAAIDANAVPPSSRDPEKPGVLAATLPPGYAEFAKQLGVPRSGGTVMLLIGTATNRKDALTRDGGGICLLAQRRAGECIVGKWASWGVVHGAEGRFRLCPTESRTR